MIRRRIPWPSKFWLAFSNELLGFASEKVQDWDEFIELVNHLYTHPTAVRSNDIVHMKDGRVLSRASVPIVSGEKIRGRAWYFRDVTETVRNERMQAALFRIATLSREARNLDVRSPTGRELAEGHRGSG